MFYAFYFWKTYFWS